MGEKTDANPYYTILKSKKAATPGMERRKIERQSTAITVGLKSMASSEKVSGPSDGAVLRIRKQR